ncbi:hypothetical protein H5V45_02015 [Nocardioides sp. KIGAM211]|uniref:Uncharacterized protein n=1 Tax=Nocardioides luti TaxID=2761101 RepID=A0A7X0RD69_9ACTN|nr:hypothetical protein [Nocardioides luti]MBB6626086.1 hypothetical protein [Nocardioides luti]
MPVILELMALSVVSLWGVTLAATAFLQRTAVKIWLWFLSIAGTLATVALSETVRQSVAAAFN